MSELKAVSLLEERVMSGKITTYGDFWPYYLQEHAKSLTRGLHYVGTGLALTCLALGIAGDSVWFIAMPFAGYGFAWIAHFFIEKNRPATLTYPAWSLVSDFRMFGLWLTGRLKPHLDRAGVE